MVRDALRVIADLCSGEGNVWREIKQLERISAFAGFAINDMVSEKHGGRGEPAGALVAELSPTKQTNSQGPSGDAALNLSNSGGSENSLSSLK